MRIFVISGTDDGGNLGDLAMLQIAVQRLKSLWPDARLQVLTRAPGAMKIYCPDAEPVPSRGVKRWLRVGALPRIFFPRIRPELRRHFPLTFNRFWQLGGLLYPPDYLLARQFAGALFNSDLLVLSGCGLINDVFQYAALRVLNVFAAAIQCGMPTFMLGQGIGPIRSEKLRKRAAEVLPHVNAIFLREQRAGKPLLERLGVPEQKIFTTGDDTVELAFGCHRATPGTDIGVNLRLAGYSALDDKILETFRGVLEAKARQCQTGLTGIPILCGGTGSDVQTLERLLCLSQNNGDSGEKPVLPLEAIRLIANCRVVVAGSYHAGVFALSQGIPVVAVVQADYYRDKFYGLADQFGDGCVVLRADDPGFADKLGLAIDRLWQTSGALRPGLLAAAARQTRAAQYAYAQIPDIIGRGCPI